HARATTLLYAGIGYLHARRRHGPASDDDTRIFIDLLTGR
ncbi:TetR/AcrR family transcriptional regulator, partial [Streptomyces sp. SID10244]|nr:TetR/AcrR family transcriptional regulator [Streptomyces sp. SID10244]